MKKLTKLLLLSILIFMLAACSGTAVESGSDIVTAAVEAVVSTDGDTAVTTQQTVVETAVPVTVKYASEDLEISADTTAMTTISLEGDAISVAGAGTVVNGSSITITAAGTYSLSGTLNNGQIIVETADEDPVALVLNGVDITYATSSPIYVSNAEKVVITLADGTENVVTDGASYVFPDAETDEPNAAVFSKDDLTINGSGSLTVNANYNNGIASKDDLKIVSGNITINAVNDGIKGRDSVAVKDGVITINAGADGMQSNNDEDVERGYIAIEGGTLNITAALDGIQAETSLSISGGNVTITTTGGSGDSAKGLKAGSDITISGGTITLDAADDGIHSNGNITINGGDIVAASADDGVHANASLVINGGNLTITKSYEGLESGIIIINDGVVYVTASDDGINVSNGSGGMAGPGQTVSSNYYLEINGGYIVVNAGGDGLDANGLGTMNDGVVIVNGPVMNMNGALDIDGTLVVNGGFLVAVGSAGMAQNASTASTQYTVLETLPSVQAAGTMVHIKSEDGEEILTFVPTKEFQTVVISSPELANGSTYTVYLGGSATGTVADGLYADGVYTPGSQVSSFTITSIVTGGGGQMGGPGGGGPGGGGRPSRP